MEKKRHILLSLLVFFTGMIAAQSPGGIAANNKMWVRGDNGVSTSGTTVTQWQEVSGANVTGSFTVQPLTGTTNVQGGPTFIPAGINFNPYLSFNGTTNSLSSANNFLGTALVGNSNVTVFQVLNMKGGVVWLKWETDVVGATARLGFENSTGRLRFDFPRASPATAGQNIGVTNILNKHTLSTAYVNVNTSVNRLNGANDQVISIPGPGNFAATSTKIVLGNEMLLNLPCQIDLAEVIIYSNTLTAAEINKVESYLAVKYGFTLNQLAANNNNYTASNGTIIWDRALNSGYANNITGIGRDDASALAQKQSKSINTPAIVTLFNGTYPGGVFPSTNAGNTNDFPSDLSFFLAGDNGGDTTLNVCIMNNRLTRMSRVWKVQNTGSVGNVTVAVDNNILPCVKNLLVSADPNFPDNQTTVIPMTSGAYNYAVASLSSGDYFSFASDSLQLPQLVDTQACPGNIINLTIQNPQQGCIAYQWFGSATAVTPLATGTGFTLNPFTGDTSLYVSVRGTGNCLLDSRTPVNVTRIIISPPLVTSASICPGDTVRLQVQSPQPGETYTWYDAATGGNILATGNSFTTPPLSANTVYYVQASIPAGCISDTRTPVPVNIDPPPPAPSVISPVNICPSASATLQVQNPQPGLTYQWYASPNGTVLSAGTTYTTGNLTSAATYYVTASNATGCESGVGLAQVDLWPQLPAPQVSVADSNLSSISFTWNAVAGASGYLVSVDGISYGPPSSGATGTSHVVTGLSPSQTVTLYVIATQTPDCRNSQPGSASGTTWPLMTDVYVPTAFTPNSDALNDVLYVIGTTIKRMEFSIYNRYGQKIFYSTDTRRGWDGSFRGAAQRNGSFVFYLKAELLDGSMRIKKGTITLIR